MGNGRPEVILNLFPGRIKRIELVDVQVLRIQELGDWRGPAWWELQLYEFG